MPPARPPRAAARLWPRSRQKRPRAAALLAQKCPRPAVDSQKMQGRGRISAVRAAAALPKHQACRRGRAYTYTRARARGAPPSPPLPGSAAGILPVSGHGPGQIGARGARRNSASFMHGAWGRVPAARLCKPCDDPKVVQHHGKKGHYEPRQNRPAARLPVAALPPGPRLHLQRSLYSSDSIAMRSSAAPLSMLAAKTARPLWGRIPRSPCGGVRGQPVREPAVLAAGRVLGDRLGIAACLDGRRVLPDDPLDGLPPGGRHEKAQAPPVELLATAAGQGRGRAGPAAPLPEAPDVADHPAAGCWNDGEARSSARSADAAKTAAIELRRIGFLISLKCIWRGDGSV